ncbi:MAG TPA: acyl carrier protein [Micromonosporaceae bacterium]|nr:acyl carrier protein [Micromonosporaceae bacterium]
MSQAGADAIQAELQEWLCVHLAIHLGVPGGRIDPAERMSAYGLDSLKAVAMLTEVEQRMGFEIDPSVLWDHPTVAAFTRFLADQSAMAALPLHQELGQPTGD